MWRKQDSIIYANRQFLQFLALINHNCDFHFDWLTSDMRVQCWFFDNGKKPFSKSIYKTWKDLWNNYIGDGDKSTLAYCCSPIANMSQLVSNCAQGSVLVPLLVLIGGDLLIAISHEEKWLANGLCRTCITFAGRSLASHCYAKMLELLSSYSVHWIIYVSSWYFPKKNVFLSLVSATKLARVIFSRVW